MNNCVQKTYDYLLNTYNESEWLKQNPNDKAYRFEHTLRVAKHGRNIAKAEGLNEDALVVGCLLHDISYCEELDTEEAHRGHGRRSAALVKDFVHSLGFDNETTMSILYGIAIHVDNEADFPGERTPLALSISDADNLDRFDVYRIYEGMQYDDFRSLSIADKLNYCESRIERLEKLKSYTMATDYATQLFQKEVVYTHEFFSKLLLQLRNSIW